MVNTATSAADLVSALERRLAKLNDEWTRAEDDALIHGDPLPNRADLNLRQVALEDALSAARARAEWEANEPARRAAFLVEEAKLFEQAARAKAKTESKTRELLALLDSNARLAEEIRSACADEERPGRTKPGKFQAAGGVGATVSALRAKRLREELIHYLTYELGVK